MYLHLFLLFSSGVSSSFLPLKEMPHPQNKTKHTIIDEMLCLLDAENESIKVQLSEPLHIMNPTCAHKTTEKFIHELKRIPKWTCMKTVEKDMEELEKKCSILKKSSSNDKSCSDTAKTSFSQFKESLKEFLRWVNEKQDCSNIVRNESNFFLDSKCSCPDPWDHRKALL